MSGVRDLLGRARRRLRGSAAGSTAAGSPLRGSGAPEAARRRYGRRGGGPALSYGTVADLADSREHLGWLVGSSFDMKSLQRCWALKEILATVEAPGPLLEIGAGEPFVADALSRVGYRVTIVDPYDGTGTGPVELDLFRRRYPDLRFVEDTYPSAAAVEPQAAVYSISVLEHLPTDAAAGVARAAREQGARNIHAIDHVLRGWGDAEHHSRLAALVAGFGSRTPTSSGCSPASMPTRRPTSCPPRRTRSGAGRLPTTTTRCDGSARSTSTSAADRGSRCAEAGERAGGRREAELDRDPDVDRQVVERAVAAA